MRKSGLALVVALALVSCRTTAVRDETKALASRGQAAGTRVAELYEALARDTVDVWELTAFRRGFLKLPAGADTRSAFEEQYKLLRSRARLARRMANAYESLGTLAAYDALDDMETELKGVKRSPAVDKVIAAIALWKQSGDLHQGARSLRPLAEAMRDLFRSERELYDDIVEERADKYRQVAIELVKAKEVVSTPLVNRVLASYELSWPDTKQPFADERTIAGIVEMIDARSHSFAAKSYDDIDAAANALDSLVEAHR